MEGAEDVFNASADSFISSHIKDDTGQVNFKRFVQSLYALDDSVLELDRFNTCPRSQLLLHADSRCACEEREDTQVHTALAAALGFRNRHAVLAAVQAHIDAAVVQRAGHASSDVEHDEELVGYLRQELTGILKQGLNSKEDKRQKQLASWRACCRMMDELIFDE